MIDMIRPAAQIPVGTEYRFVATGGEVYRFAREPDQPAVHPSGWVTYGGTDWNLRLLLPPHHPHPVVESTADPTFPTRGPR